jgi:hypothetical protein
MSLLRVVNTGLLLVILASVPGKGVTADDRLVKVVRRRLAKDYPFAGGTGMSPIWSDVDGKPTGVPVQVSRNWHKQAGRRLLYEGSWFHGFAILRLPALATLDCQLTLTYARWGGIPAASHAQLCLIG